LQIYTKYVGVIVGILILAVLSSGCVSIGGFAQVLNLGDKSSNFTELNKTPNGTYSIASVTFKCPDSWAVSTFNNNGKTTIAAVQINESSFQPQFMIDIIPNKNNSEQEAVNQAKNEIYFGYKKISDNMTTIDGNKAYESIYAINDPIAGKSKFELIYFVKNGKTYIITFSAANKDFDKEKANFDMILKSFKVQ